MLKEGQVVFALAGRDKGKYFIVLHCDGEYAYICDGKRRPVERPKRKKLMHLRPTMTFATQAGTNREIRRILLRFRENDSRT